VTPIHGQKQLSPEASVQIAHLNSGCGVSINKMGPVFAGVLKTVINLKPSTIEKLIKPSCSYDTAVN
jgi:hypothetical protein